jgi:group I intron endonuclease
MIIYKITNKKNGKVYIGQTIGTAEARWKRHQNDALNRGLDTHFARAIRKYGSENFEIEEIDSKDTQEELTLAEKYWICRLNAVEKGYNETDATFKCGGNTYKSKNKKELEQIGEKIRESKLGGKNPHATAVKCKSTKTHEEYFFNSQAEMQRFFNAANHLFISRRCLGEIRSLYKNEWMIAYADKEYNEAYKKAHQRSTANRPKEIQITELSSGEMKSFCSYAEAERYFHEKPRSFSSKAYKRGNEFTYKDKYKITKIY